ncbi:MAG: hypothetical protein UV64_C0007G0046 [Parcubacteria group bacterium GW2011_GWC1_43_11b]|nr:MAG: hypothetical protein UV64_C0007G0046 [Parcubacteria group bacterium GW2011_GWC1_43_11b]
MDKILESLEGNEIWSRQFEGCVVVRGGKVIKDGKAITRISRAQRNELFQEAFENEFGTRDIKVVLQQEGIL